MAEGDGSGQCRQEAERGGGREGGLGEDLAELEFVDRSGVGGSLFA